MKPARIMLVVTHLLGTGHLARIAAIGKALAQRGAAVTLVSGGRAAPMVQTGAVDVVQLPPLHCVDADFRRLLDDSGAQANDDLMERRRRLLLATFDRVAPDALVTELYPFGRRALRDEFEALLAHARDARPRPMIVASIRDILNPPSRPERVAEAMQSLGRSYDRVLFHGDSAFVPCDMAWPVSPELKRRMVETGYVRDDERPAPRATATGAGGIVVSAGGSAAGAPLLQAALEAARFMPERTWRLLVGHGVSARDFDALREQASGNVVVERARSDFAELLRQADLSISQAGYNTVLDLAAAGARALLVPYAEGGEKEQGLRAQALAQRGLASVLTAGDLSGAALAEASVNALAAPRPDWSSLRRDGARNSADILIELCDSARRRDTAWRRLDALLAQAKRERRMLRFWLRDDDAVASSAALSRFLEQLSGWAIPAAFAVIPSHATESLAAQLTPTPHAVLTHGWAHANHAPSAQKKAEFGAHRDIAAMLDEARRGGEILSRLFGTRALRIFAPPWNRIDGKLALRLQEAGFRGLSAYGRRPRESQDGFVQVNAHWDPIDWRHGGGLACESGLIERLCDLIAEELAAPDHALEPIGLLTHHLVHDAWIGRFLDGVFARLLGSGAARFLHPEEVFAAA